MAQNIADATTTLAVKTTAAIQGTERFDARDAVHRHCEYRLEATEGPRKGSRTVALDSWIDTPSGPGGKKYLALKADNGSLFRNVEVYHMIGDEAFVAGGPDVFVVTAGGVTLKIQPSPITPIGIPVIRCDSLTTLGEQAADYIQH
jgi:hypothetical protein